MRKKTVNLLIFIGVVTILNYSCSEKTKPGITGTLVQNTALLNVAPVFVPLTPGAVTPEGWIRDWAEDAAKGITGHLGEYSPTFGKAWKGYGFEARGATADGGGWPLEQCSYWLDGAIRLGYILHDSVLIKKASTRLDTVVNGVLRGGETFIYWLPKEALIDSTQGWVEFNSWAHSHMGRALVAYYQASGKEKVLQALTKVYRNYSLPKLMERFWAVTGSVNIDPMMDTYLLTGDTAIRNHINSFGNKKKYQTLITNWNAGKLQHGHSVIFYENIRVPALFYLFSGNKQDLNATLNALNWAESSNLLPVGVTSGEEFHAGIGATRNIETCDVSASINTFNRLLQITGEEKYSDKIEKVFFNAAPAPVSRDFSTMCYYQSMNRYSNQIPNDEPYNPGKDCFKFTKIGHGVLCCVANNCRILPNYIMNMWMATQDHGLAATLYGPCKVKAVVADGVTTEIICKTNYPFGETIQMTVNPSRTAEFPIYLRVPEWCANPAIKVNGETLKIEKQGSGFVKILRKWKMKDKIVLALPMTVKVVQGNETPYPQISYFDHYHKMAKDTTINNPYALVYYGPLLFSLPIPDIDPNQEAPGAKFNYALDVRPENAAQKITVERKVMPEHWNWSLDAPIKLTVDAQEFDWKPTENKVLPEKPIEKGTPVKIQLVPYGTTKFRVTMFPVTAASYRK
ncbi:MAG: glycoside hydrolase family 127 protein [Bacteroidota bacterium]|nr:glycoside hydrolase family 127 protein [Bacteroidota bacterium]